MMTTTKAVGVKKMPIKSSIKKLIKKTAPTKKGAKSAIKGFY